MTISPNHLPEATVVVGALLALVSLAIIFLRHLRKVLVMVAALVVIGWGVVLYPKYKDQIRLDNLPDVHIEFPNRKAPESGAPSRGSPFDTGPMNQREPIL